MATADMTSSTVLVHASTAAYRRIGNEVVIVDTAAGRMMSLNETGSAIWSMLGKYSVAQIAEQLVALYDVTPDTAMDETEAFLKEMRRRGLVEVSPRAAQEPGP